MSLQPGTPEPDENMGYDDQPEKCAHALYEKTMKLLRFTFVEPRHTVLIGHCIQPHVDDSVYRRRILTSGVVHGIPAALRS